MEEQRSPVKARVGEGERSSLGILVRKKFLKKVNFSLVGLIGYPLGNFAEAF